MQGADTLVISAEVPGHGILHRRVTCPISASGSGRNLVGQTIGFRHIGFDDNDVDDAFVVRWPAAVDRAPAVNTTPTSMTKVSMIPPFGIRMV